MLIDGHDLDKDVLVVAEIGNNHEGSLERARHMIGLAARAGAHAVKFQTIVPELLVEPSQAARLEQLRRLCLPPAAFEALRDTARDEGVIFLSTPFDLESVRLLDPLVPAFKIASGDNDFLPLLRAVAATGKPVLLSTGLCGAQSVLDARDALEAAWSHRGLRGQLVLLHCVGSYPTPPDQANLLAIRALAELGHTVGYSDHTLGTQAAVLAVALGARVVEKHFTLDHGFSDFRDHKLSADPAQLAQLVRAVREAQDMLGQGFKQPMPCEEASLVAARRSAYAARDLAAGELLTPDAVAWLRPGGGIPATDADLLAARRLARPLKRGERIEYACLGPGA